MGERKIVALISHGGQTAALACSVGSLASLKSSLWRKGKDEKSVANVCTRNEKVDVAVVTSGYPGLGRRLQAAAMLATYSAPPASVAALRPLCQDHTQLRVVSVLVDVVNADVPLQIVRSRVAMLLVRAEGAKKEGLGRTVPGGVESAYQMYPGLW